VDGDEFHGDGVTTIGDGVKADGDGVGTGKFLWRLGWCLVPRHSLVLCMDS